MPRYPNDARQAGNYTAGVQNVNEYVFSPGVCVLPLAEDPPESAGELATWSPVVVLRLHAPFRTRNFTQVSGKEANPPPINAPGNQGAFVFLGGTVGVVENLSTTLQNLNWAVSASYSYVENCTSQDTAGDPLGLVLGTLPFGSILDRFNATTYGYQPPLLGAAAQGGVSVTAGYNAGNTIVGAGNTGALKDAWSYNAQAFYPATLFYSDLANGGKPVVEGGQL